MCIDFVTLLKDHLRIPDEVDMKDPINFHKFVLATLEFVEQHPEHELVVLPIKLQSTNYLTEYLCLASASWFKLEEVIVVQFREKLKGVEWNAG